jgi:hypothetical protein
MFEVDQLVSSERICLRVRAAKHVDRVDIAHGDQYAIRPSFVDETALTSTCEIGLDLPLISVPLHP